MPFFCSLHITLFVSDTIQKTGGYNVFLQKKIFIVQVASLMFDEGGKRKKI